MFITHDLEEAIKLADRVAIMDRGEMVQIASPEQLVLAPANDYVRRFTSKVPLAKVMRVGTIADRSVIMSSPKLVIRSSQTVEEVAQAVLAHDGPVAVSDDSGLIGRIDREQIIEVLAGNGRVLQERLHIAARSTGKSGKP